MAVFELKPTFNQLYLKVCSQFTEQMEPGNKHNKYFYIYFLVEYLNIRVSAEISI